MRWAVVRGGSRPCFFAVWVVFLPTRVFVCSFCLDQVKLMLLLLRVLQLCFEQMLAEKSRALVHDYKPG